MINAIKFKKEIGMYEWWGYLHSNGTVQLKRWYGDHKDYTEDCENNDFVVKVIPPFKASSYEEAMSKLINSLK